MNNNDKVSKPKYGPFYSRKRKRKMANPILCCIPETQCTGKKKRSGVSVFICFSTAAIQKVQINFGLV